jgi:hypothetical protein
MSMPQLGLGEINPTPKDQKQELLKTGSKFRILDPVEVKRMSFN